jgi:hypothetical protein
MRYFKFLSPLLLVVVVDILFQLGVWEPLASPESNAGTSILRKRALSDPAFAHLDFVTLGSSRPVYGIDHAALAKAAAAQGYTYANLSIPGVHWMTVGMMADWLVQRHPEIRGGVIALSVQDFLAPGNGPYEVGLAYPFRSIGQIDAMAQHVPFNWHDPATYGLYSGLFAYHEDIQDALAHPVKRKELLSWFRALPPQHTLTENADVSSNMCATPIEHLSDCSRFVPDGTPGHDRIPEQCRLLQDKVRARYDLRPYLNDSQSLPPHLQKAREIIRARLLALRWPTPPIVVLMPMPLVWQNDINPPGAREWALSVLAPLQAEGKIRVLDYTDAFSADSSTDCAAFFDLYHNNVAGRTHLMEQLMPELQQGLFESDSRVTSGPTPN